MLVTTCHCGAVKVSVPRRPRRLTLCNCAICRRLGGLWAYYPVDQVVVLARPGATESYIWGDRTLRPVRCKTCSCAPHWEPLQRGPASKMGVNARNFEPGEVAHARLRRFDGASSWRYVDA